MDEFVNKSLFTIVGVIWSVIQITMGFFMKYWFDRNERDKAEMKADIKENKNLVEGKLETMIKDFQSGVDSLRSVVTDIKELVTVVKTQHTAELAEINRRLERKKEWLEDHDEKLEQHDRQIIEIKSDCKHHHGNKL